MTKKRNRTQYKSLLRYCLNRRRIANRNKDTESAKAWDKMYWQVTKAERKAGFIS